MTFRFAAVLLVVGMNSDFHGHAAVIAGAPQGVRQGFYLGSWRDQAVESWLLLYLDPERQSGVIDAPPVVLDLCDFRVSGDSITFKTPQLEQSTAGYMYNLLFTGRSTADGLQGMVTVIGGVHKGMQVRTDLKFYGAESASSADSAKQGLFSFVTLNEASGDNHGDELLLIKTPAGLLALHTEYAGATPNGPRPVDSLEWHGDTIAGVVDFGTRIRPLVERVKWVVRPGPPPSGSGTQPESGILYKTYTIREFLGSAGFGSCTNAR